MAIFDKRVRATELRIISAIASYADKDGYAYPAVKTLAARLGVSRAAVQKQIKLAVKHGYIEITSRKRPTGGHASNLYRVNLFYSLGDDGLDTEGINEGDSYDPSGKTGKQAQDDWPVF